jgi:hypothetical protein
LIEWITLLAMLAVLTQSKSASYLGVAIAEAVAAASFSGVLAGRRYLRRKRPPTAGPLGIIVMLILIWIVVFGIALFFLYYPYTPWELSWR